jgi:hypothetical protein
MYYKHHRTHNSLGADTPVEGAKYTGKLQTALKAFRWQTDCRGRHQLSAAA